MESHLIMKKEIKCNNTIERTLSQEENMTIKQLLENCMENNMEELKRYPENCYYDISDITEGDVQMGEIADDAREDEFNNWFSLSETEREKYKAESRLDKALYNLRVAQNYDNTVWKDRNGNVTSFLDMDGFHLWNVRTFILRSHNRGLQNKLMYIDLALAKLNYTVDDYRKDCERLKKENMQRYMYE